jgi:murein DD-endopeptidase MepM/ murein hydrolase activator NlpD
MKAFFPAAMVCLAAITGSAAPTRENTAPSVMPGPAIGLRYRSLQPGETILVSLDDSLGIRFAVLRFRGRFYVLDEAAPFALIGLDLDSKPGTYPMEITITRTDRGPEAVRKDVIVEAKEFSKTKLWVKEAYAVPPKEVEERIAREAELLASVFSMITKKWLGDGDFIVPHEGKAFPNFGQRRIYNNRPRSTHTGVDIAAPLGDPVRATNAGKIVLASDLYLGGKTVIIDHGQGIFSSYGHMSKLLVKRGGTVHKGEIIGLSGSTGRSTGPHLHWGMRIYEARIDPFSLLGLHIAG